MGNKGGGDDVAVTMAAMATVVAAAANKGGGAWRRWVVDLIDRDTGSHFGVRRKLSSENFFDGGSRRRVAGSGGGWPNRHRRFYWLNGTGFAADGTGPLQTRFLKS
nr:hypothetical protein [Tanacetum cinerariifolium]